MSNARDKANIPALNFSSTGIDDNATSTAITIDSNQRVGFGESSNIEANLHIRASNSNVTPNANADELFVENSGTAGITIGSGTSSYGNIFFGDSDDNNRGAIQYNHSNNSMTLNTDNSERMRIDSSGSVGIGTSSPSSALDVIGGLTIDGNDNNFTHGITRQTGTTNASRPVIKLTVKNTASDVTDGFGSSIQFRMKDNTADTELGAIGFIRDGADGSGAFAVGQDSQLLQSSPQFIVDSSGNVGIGTSSPGSLLHIDGTNPKITVGTSGSNVTFLQRVSDDFYIFNRESAGHLLFGTADTERMRIDSSGNLLINTTSQIEAGKLGIDCGVGDNGIDVIVGNTGGGNTGIRIYRTNSDGSLISFSQGGTTEGQITVSGSTVTYGSFTGVHWSRFTDNSTPNILRGTVLESLDEMCDWYNLEFNIVTQDEDDNDVTNTKKIPHVLTDSQSNGDVITYNHEGTDYQATIVKETDIKHMKSKVSDTIDAKNVYGVFNAYDLDGEGYNDFYVASVGSFVVRIKQGETIAKGDLLQSNGDGTAKVQTDDAVRSSSFAKVLSTTVIETYDDGSYLVPCSLMC